MGGILNLGELIFVAIGVSGFFAKKLIPKSIFSKKTYILIICILFLFGTVAATADTVIAPEMQ